ncbi:minor tail protein [Arthrobacter phage Ryan]|uniref:Minor tail protein n=2 Tax=Nanditavirus TaxID=3152637 RepID=A0A3G2KJF6_9CAUD|nr:minor tail protein [Arthrobacter phage Ryan]YP_010761057.1 minor tail protein [Arthrobacter phage Zaheer]AYN59020.1 minor tail protein [Arthrobacter phage Ryan]QWY84229.1 minor tail protein [Arthrobacter phage Zaheer]
MPGLPGSQFPGEDARDREIKDLKRQVQQFAAANVLATAGIGVIPNGVLVNGLMQFNRQDGTLGVQVDPVTGTFTAYDATGTTQVARFGSLQETAPGSYGVEVLVGGTWVQLGAQVATWANLAGKPSTFAPSAHTHPGGDITSAVANATNATNATKAAQADGSQYGWTNTVAGTEFYAVWVGNDGGFHFGRNTSSIRYKENVRDASTADAVLSLRPVVYDRKPTYKYPELEDGTRCEGPPQRFEGAKDELGLIAEEVDPHLPQIVTRYGGEIDGVRYDLLGVALLPVVQEQVGQIAEQAGQIAEQAEQIAALTAAVRELGGNI